MRRIALGFLLFACVHGPVRADGPLAAEDRWPVRAGGRLTLDGGVAIARPTSLGTGLSTGIGAGAMFGGWASWGVRASWSSATESSIAWMVTQADLKLRAAGALQHSAGRGRFGLRLGIGPTVVHETRLRNQGARAGLTGTDLETSAFATRAAADLEAAVAVHIAGPWLLTASGGPSWTLTDGHLQTGWTALIGTGWQP